MRCLMLALWSVILRMMLIEETMMPNQVLLDITIEALRLEPVNGGSKSWDTPLRSYFNERDICVLQHDRLIQEFEESRLLPA